MAKIAGIYDRLIVALAYLAGATTVAILAVIVIDVVLRMFHFRVPGFAVATAECLLIYLTMLSAPYIARTRGHVQIGLFIDALPDTPRRYAEKTIYILIIVVCLIFTAISSKLLWSAFTTGLVDVRGIDLPVWLMVLPCPIGFFLLATEFGRYLFSGASYFKPIDESETRL